MKGTKFFGIRIALAACVLALLLVVEAGFISIASAARLERYCVVFEKADRKAVKDAIMAQFGDVIKKELKLVDVVAVVLPSAADAEKLTKIPGVKSVAPDVVYIDPAGKPPKPPAGEKLPWGVDRIDADKVWDKDGNLSVDPGANTGSGIKVAIVDSGIDLDHPDLAANISGINTIDGQDPNRPDDQYGHGTMIAGVIAAIDNSVGVIGVGPGISLYAVKITVNFDLSDLTNLSNLYEGMEWCIQNNMQVINMSLSLWSVIDDGSGNYVKDKPLNDPTFYSYIQQAYQAGIVLAAAVANDSARVEEVQGDPGSIVDTSPYRFPASYNEVIGVSATGINTGGKPSEKGDYFASWSNYGPAVDLAAPGVSVETTTIGGYGSFGGTSASCPHVVGVAALILNQLGATSPIPGLPEQVKTTLKNKAEQLAKLTAEQQGAGLVDAANAVGIQAAPRQHIVSPAGKLSVAWGKIKAK
jgi:subtilisin family serine protease